MMGVTAMVLLGMGRLDEALRLAQQAMLLGKQPGGRELPDVSLPAFSQAEVLREWNQLDAAHALIEEAILLGEQVESYAVARKYPPWLLLPAAYYLSRRELEAACSALRKVEDVGRSMPPALYRYLHSLFTTTDQVRLWLACGELDRAMGWAEQLEIEERHSTPFAHEREEVARARILLAKDQPVLALQRLEPVLQRATAGQRWRHVIEIRFLQALAHQMHQEETQALQTLSETVRLAEPEGYIRSFVDEGRSDGISALSATKAQQGARTNSLSGHAAGCISAGDEDQCTDRRANTGTGAIEQARARGPAVVGARCL